MISGSKYKVQLKENEANTMRYGCVKTGLQTMHMHKLCSYDKLQSFKYCKYQYSTLQTNFCSKYWVEIKQIQIVRSTFTYQTS